MRIGINTFGLSTMLAEDFEGTLKVLRTLGADGLEVCLLCRRLTKEEQEDTFHFGSGLIPMDAAVEMIRAIRDAGLRVEGAHILGADFEEQHIENTAQSLIDFARENQLRYYVLSLAAGSVREAAPWVPGLNVLASRLKSVGIGFLYHNHEMELRDDGGDTALDYFMRQAPQMDLELDVGWACFAGCDPVQVMERYASRIRILHFKDFSSDTCEENRCFTAIGEGTLPLERVMEAAKSLTLYDQGFVLDQDASNTDMPSDIEASLRNLRAGKDVTTHAKIPGNPLQLSVWSMPCLDGEKPGSFLNLMQACTRMGVKRVDMMDFEIRIYGEEMVRHILTMTDMRLGCYISTLPMNEGPSDMFRGYLHQALSQAQSLGAGKMMIVPSEIQCTVDGDDRKDAADRIARCFAEAVEEAKKYGIPVCVEDDPTCYVPLSTAEECAALLDRVPGLGLAFDTANMLPSGDTPERFYEKLKGRVTHVHLKDVVYAPQGEPCLNGQFIRCVPTGLGVVPVRKLMERLIADGYTGSAMLEYVSPPDHSYRGHKEQLQRFLNALFA
jgi:sugar phosphate isomerase/epimerase